MADKDKGGEPQEFDGIEIPLDSEDTKVRIGDWEGPASHVRKQFVPQSELQKMREKDKQKLQQQVQQAQEQARQEAALQYQQQLQKLQQQQAQGQQPTQGQMNLLERLKQAAQDHQGYLHVDQMNPVLNELVSRFQNELQARDQLLAALGQKLDGWYGDYQKKSEMLEKLTGGHADQTWNSFIEELSSDFDDLPQSTIDKIASAYQADENMSPDELKSEIREAVKSEQEAFKKHQAQRQQAQRERQQKAKDAGIPGAGGKGQPSRPGKPLRSSDEIVDHFTSEGELPA